MAVIKLAEMSEGRREKKKEQRLQCVGPHSYSVDVSNELPCCQTQVQLLVAQESSMERQLLGERRLLPWRKPAISGEKVDPCPKGPAPPC